MTVLLSCATNGKPHNTKTATANMDHPIILCFLMAFPILLDFFFSDNDAVHCMRLA